MNELAVLSLIVSLIFTELTNLLPGGIIVPFYFALYLDDPVKVAATVLSALVEGMEQRRVDVWTEAKVCGIEKRDDGFLVWTAEQSFPAGRVI